ncbi:hypothetical protein A7K93_10760 [Candidatus Methylacidiphilum fumarolicum]|uniref:TPR repeats containing protein n=2 Tax=Candidatus Methylacidiphilum fumarolicum TaxID=591154 RepID=I0K0P6_METFB|nr:tetratricopeptide repeat protein [Candidatus Methylacidiphilum fumarolicum]MBW6414767.1 tetratricopeptide repeat protein [Candidatus Methylacidiphilum fumarolicum]TFE68041.1 hypothetical protein A7K73_08140 [Candidatus Methylacidiphilum fumarolicum]TFE71490.1 hypothetical protein A7K93_10760 [Candidatus Methylacidiphilum fumarolicum]TFE72020.1 hypothetical protein A7K72_09590 [Candidatus Methylacidiphilum fumarolicum]TFE75561.1 hypothetical protein A7D33_10890 [Candidatus Methylacidiphilum 
MNPSPNRKPPSGTLFLIGTVSLFLLLSLGLFGYKLAMEHSKAKWEKVILSYQAAKTNEEKLKIAKAHLSNKQAAVWILQIAGNLYEKGAISEALSTFQFFLEHFPGHPLEAGAMLGAGECLESQGQTQQAVLLYQRILEKKDTEAYRALAILRLAQIRIQKKEYGPAKELLEKFLSQNARSPFANQAQMLLEMIPSS